MSYLISSFLSFVPPRVGVLQKSHHEVEKDNILVHAKHDNVKYNNIL